MSRHDLKEIVTIMYTKAADEILIVLTIHQQQRATRLYITLLKKKEKEHLSIRYAICSGTREQSMQVWMQVHLSSIKNTVCRSPEPLIIAARTKFDQTYFYFVALLHFSCLILAESNSSLRFKQVFVPVKLPPKRGKV